MLTSSEASPPPNSDVGRFDGDEHLAKLRAVASEEAVLETLASLSWVLAQCFCGQAGRHHLHLNLLAIDLQLPGDGEGGWWADPF